MLWTGRKFRHLTPEGNYKVEAPGVVLGLSAMILLGVSLPLLLRSPLRMPAGERLFRLVWLGPLGRAFLKFAGRRAPRDRDAGAPPVITAAPARNSNGSGPHAVRVVAADGDRVAALEQRVADLERWRQKSGLPS